MPVSSLGPAIVVNFLLDGNLAANFILHIDDEIIIDNEIITVIEHTSEETMQELGDDTPSLPDEESPEAYDKWVKDNQSRVLDIIRAHKEKMSMEDDGEDIFSSVEAFESFMRDNFKTAMDDIMQKRVFAMIENGLDNVTIANTAGLPIKEVLRLRKLYAEQAHD